MERRNALNCSTLLHASFQGDDERTDAALEAKRVKRVIDAERGRSAKEVPVLGTMQWCQKVALAGSLGQGFAMIPGVCLFDVQRARSMWTFMSIHT